MSTNHPLQWFRVLAVSGFSSPTESAVSNLLFYNMLDGILKKLNNIHLKKVEKSGGLWSKMITFAPKVVKRYIIEKYTCAF